MRNRNSDSFDAIVVGAGVIGLASAWRAAQRGLSVCVLDRESPGSGASRVAAGMLAPVGETTWGEDDLLHLNLASARAYPEFAAELEDISGSSIGFQRFGALHVALDRDEAEELRRWHRLLESLDLDAEWMRPRQCRELEPGLSTACTAGVQALYEGQVDPRSLVAALATAADGAGVRVITGAEIVGSMLDGDRLIGVRTADGRELHADHVVLASGAWSGVAPWLPEEERPPVRPIKGQVVTLRGPVEQSLCEGIVATQRVYVVPRGDGRVVVGATVEERGFDLTVTAGGLYELLREAYRVLPEVVELELVETIAGLRPGTPDNGPVVGHGGLEGLILATGHHRHGILHAPTTADAVAALLAGQEPLASIRPFGPERFHRGRGDGERDAARKVEAR